MSHDTGLKVALDEMARLIRKGAEDPRVQQWAKPIVDGIKDGSAKGKAAALLIEIRRNVRYSADPSREELRLVLPLLDCDQPLQADDDELAVAFAACCVSQGLVARVRYEERGCFSFLPVIDVWSETGEWVRFYMHESQVPREVKPKRRLEHTALDERLGLTACHATYDDGDCIWRDCPQLRDGEPKKTGRHCPLDTRGHDGDEGRAGG